MTKRKKRRELLNCKADLVTVLGDAHAEGLTLATVAKHTGYSYKYLSLLSNDVGINWRPRLTDPSALLRTQMDIIRVKRLALK